MKRVVFLVLLVVMSVSLFNIDTYYNPLSTYDYSIIFLNNVNGNYNLTLLVNWIKDFQIQSTRFDLIEIENTGTNPFDYKYMNLDDFRTDEIDSSSFNDFNVYASLQQANQLDCILSMCNTVFVVLLVIISAMLISRDATELVLQPLEALLFKVNDMAEDPFRIPKFNEEEDSKGDHSKDKNKIQYETMILDNAITKIRSLLLLGFGEAGSRLVSDMISKEGELTLSTRK